MSKTGANHYISQLGLPDKGPAIKGLVVCGTLPAKSCNLCFKLIVSETAIFSTDILYN